MNVCTFSGRVGRDPELRHMPNGDPVLGWPLAVDTGTRDKPATMWLDCRIFGKRGESLQQYIGKGAKLTVSGRLVQEEYQARDGSGAKFRLKLTVDQVELPPKGDASAPAPAPARAPMAAPGRKDHTPLSDMDDDIPFS
jgi:single-strand DNA-binding protein